MADWAALSEFVASQRVRQLDIEASIRTAVLSGTDRIVPFESAHAVKLLIDKISAYAITWEVRWAVPLNRILPRLFQAISAGEE